MKNLTSAAYRSMQNHSFMVMFALFSLLMSQLAFAADKDPEVAWDKINAGATVIDVRTAEEFAAGHLDNAINIPFEEIAVAINTLDIAKDTQIVLYCRSGRRSGIAFDTLVSEGYTQSYNGGGFETLSLFKQDNKQ
ncbi:phage shock protein E [Shewanella violacea DSS12]|uniref:Phage shock protein E n=2 Tax=Shewanella violacea TaxID=60217 RepID=D4ZMJ1_SHEVD|nr:phage shock protein E [Shewanella violacea DSS12]